MKARKALRVLGIGAVLLVLLATAAFALALSTEGGRLAWRNRAEFSDGVKEAELVTQYRGVAELIVRRPELASFAAWDVGHPDGGVYLAADRVRPITSVAKVIVASAVARAIARGEWEPDDTLPLEEVERLYLKGTDGNAHALAMAELGHRPAELPLETMAVMMTEWSDSAVGDTLMLKLGRQKLEEEVRELGIEGLFAPAPWVGEFAMLVEDGKPSTVPDPDRAWALTWKLAGDEVFMVKLKQRLATHGIPTLRDQREHRKASSHRGTARAYAALMEKVVTDQTVWGQKMRRWLSWPMVQPHVRAWWSQYGTKGGTGTSVVASATFAQPSDGGSPAVLALFLDDLPTRVWFELWQNFEQQTLEVDLLTNKEYRAELAGKLRGGAAP